MTDNGRSSDGREMTVGDYANGAPNIRLSQIPASFGRQIPWMIPALAIMIGASWYLTKDIKRTYVANGSILVQLGPEYVYNPATSSGSNNSGLSITPDQVVLTEIELIKNSKIIDQVVSQMIQSEAKYGVGGERFAPKLYEKWVKAPEQDKPDRWNDILKYADKNYAVMPKPKSSIVNLAYKHEDGIVAKKTLEAFMDAYKDFRKSIFVLERSGEIAERRGETEKQLAGVESSIQRILDRNNISDFTTEKVGVQTRAEERKSALNNLRGQLSAVEAALAATEDQLRATPPTINLYVDDRASQRLAQAELEKRQLLAKYLPTSNPVRSKEAEIAEIRAQISANGGKAAGGRRVGPNTVHQALMTQRNTYQAQADSFREQEITLQRQLDGASAKVKQLRKLEPTYTSLVRERLSLEERLKEYNSKEGEALVNKALDDSAAENIKEITRPGYARKGRNMKKIMRTLATLGSIFTVLMLALLRVFLDPRLYSHGSAQRSQHPGRRGRREADRSDIPEPVPAFAPVYDSEPAHMPAAVSAANVPSSFTDMTETAYVPEPVYAEFVDQSYVQPQTPAHEPERYVPEPYAPATEVPQAYGAPQMHTGGAIENPPPIASSLTSAYPVQPVQNTTPNTPSFAGAQDDVPILGSISPQPYKG